MVTGFPRLSGESMPLSWITSIPWEKRAMPIYEYHCKACGKNFETLQKISEPPLATCPACGKKVRRLISQTSFALKGGGWYKDGYASGTSPSAEQSNKAEQPQKAEKAEKPEKKAEKKADTSKTGDS